MRRLTAWIGGGLGGITAYRLLRRRPPVAPEPEAPDERADELRAKLAESRTTEPVPEPVAEEDPVEAAVEAEPEPESPDDRRRRVHEEGRAALDDMKPS
ncbi:MAG TPA: hypothetical protein VGK69_12690 [Gaiellaceae bacterium]